MRRGGRLFVFLGVIVALAAALILFVVLSTPPTSDVAEQPNIVTEVPLRQVVFARIDIPNNTVLTDTDTFLTFGDVSENEFSANPNQYFTSVDQLRNKITINQVSATRPILANDVTDAGLSLQIPSAEDDEPALKAYPLQVSNLTGVADLITPGDFVDVITSLQITQVYLRPGVNEQGELLIREQEVTNQSTKTLVQNVQVLQVIRPQPVEGTPTDATQEQVQTDPSGQPINGTQPGAGAAGPTLQAGNWLLILAVTDQEAEIIEYSRSQGTGLTLVLRGRGDNEIEDTLGATLDILVTEFGLPVPQPFPPSVFEEDDLAPVPTLAPAQDTEDEDETDQ